MPISASPVPAFRIRRLLPLLLGLLAFTARAARADFTLKLDNKDGDKISDVAKIVAHADSSDGIDKVEFQVDDQLRATATSVPYIFTWDTIPDPEGAHNLTVTAYDSNGKTKQAKVSLTIDNELGLGATALAQKAQEALTAKDQETALKYSRRALKADPNNRDAARAQASIYAYNAEWDKAIAALDKPTILEGNAPAMLDLAAYRMRRALQPENAATFFTELDTITDLRQKAADLTLAEVTKQNTVNGTVSTEGHEAIGDALMNAGKYADAAVEYSKADQGDNVPLSVVNRHALALALSGADQDSLTLTRPLIRQKKGDAATRAVMALALLRTHDFEAARALVQPDLADKAPASLVVAAYADTTLFKSAAAFAEAQDAASLLPRAGEAHYALSMTLPKLTDSEQELNRTLAFAPFALGPYLDYAARTVFEREPDRYDRALKFVDYVLKRDPTSVNARIVQSAILMAANRVPEAEPILQKLADKEKTAPDVIMLMSVYWQLKDKEELAVNLMQRVQKMDPLHFNFTIVPTPQQYLAMVTRKDHYRGGFFLSPSTLYPAK